MQQWIVQEKFGTLLLLGWNGLDLGLVGYFEALPFREKEETNWTEFILGFTANYRWHDRNTLSGSFSWGHEESSRFQLINTFTFEQTWFTSLGWRRDEFVNDGVEIVESGLYFGIGKRF